MKPAKTTYEFSKEELSKLIAKELGVDLEKVNLKFKITQKFDTFGRDAWHTCDGIEVEVS